MERIELAGGNPGGCLRSGPLDAFAAQPRTEPGFQRTIFVGDYRSRKVSFVGVDPAVLHLPGVGRRPRRSEDRLRAADRVRSLIGDGQTTKAFPKSRVGAHP